jgi:hypothetical protein
MTKSNGNKTPMWKPPARREYRPKAMDPGQPVTWIVKVDGRWTIPAHMDGDVYHGPSGEYIEPCSYTRTGTVWSVATSASCWWVTPDDDPASPVIVRRHGKKFSLDCREGELYQTREHEGWRENIRRAENVRRRGVYAVVNREYESRSWTGRGTPWKDIAWHADPQCPAAEGSPEWDVHTAVDVLTGRVNRQVPSSFCKTCIMLEAGAEPARELVTA